MKPILKQILIPSLSAAAGGLIVFAGLKINPVKHEIISSKSSVFQKNPEFFENNFAFLFRKF